MPNLGGRIWGLVLNPTLHLENNNIPLGPLFRESRHPDNIPLRFVCFIRIGHLRARCSLWLDEALFSKGTKGRHHYVSSSGEIGKTFSSPVDPTDVKKFASSAEEVYRVSQKLASRRSSTRARKPISMSTVQVQLVASWKASLDYYSPDQLTELSFETAAAAKKAISLLWGESLRECPHTITPDGGLIVPAAAVPYFRRANLKFTEDQVES